MVERAPLRLEAGYGDVSIYLGEDRCGCEQGVVRYQQFSWRVLREAHSTGSPASRWLGAAETKSAVAGSGPTGGAEADGEGQDKSSFPA